MRRNPPGKGGRLAMEKWDLLDGDGRPLGQTLVRGDKLRPGQYHLVVHIWVEDSKGRLLIQKRAPHLKLMPDTWAVTGGSALAGEDSLTAAARAVGGAGDRGRPFRTQTARPSAPPQLFVRSLAAPAGCAAVGPPPAERGGRRRPLGLPRAAHGDGEAPPFSSLRIPVF